MASFVEPRRPNIASADVQLPGVTDYEQVDNEIIATLSPTKGWFGALAVAIALFLMGAPHGSIRFTGDWATRDTPHR